MSDAWRRITDPQPKFTKFGAHVSVGQIPNHAKFHHAPPNGVREKRYNFFNLHYFGTPGDPRGPKFTNLCGDV